MFWECPRQKFHNLIRLLLIEVVDFLLIPESGNVCLKSHFRVFLLHSPYDSLKPSLSFKRPMPCDASGDIKSFRLEHLNGAGDGAGVDFELFRQFRWEIGAVGFMDDS